MCSSHINMSSNFQFSLPLSPPPPPSFPPTPGFLIQTSTSKPHPTHNKSVHILVLDGLDKVNMSSLFGDLLTLLENRSGHRAVRLPAISSTAAFALHESLPHYRNNRWKQGESTMSCTTTCIYAYLTQFSC